MYIIYIYNIYIYIYIYIIYIIYIHNFLLLFGGCIRLFQNGLHSDIVHRYAKSQQNGEGCQKDWKCSYKKEETFLKRTIIEYVIYIYNIFYNCITYIT